VATRKRDYKKEYKDYHGKPSQIKRRSSRNKARRKVGAPKGKDVHHKDGNPNNNSRSNLSLRTPKNQRKEGGRKTSGRKGK
jgi:hypothetical protein